MSRGNLIPSAGGNSAMLLSAALERFFFARATTVTSPMTRGHYVRAVRWVSEALGREATLADLNDETLVFLLAWLQKTRGQTPNTVNTTHKNLCCLWRWCRDKGLVFTGPTVKPIRAPRRVPRALSHDEFSRIVAAAYRMTGTIGGLPASVWWVTLLQLCTNTGMRSGELLSLEWQFINWDRGWLIEIGRASCRERVSSPV